MMPGVAAAFPTSLYLRRLFMKKIEEYVRSIPDFPEPGIIFRDVTSILQDADGLKLAIDSMQDCLKDVDGQKVVIIDDLIATGGTVEAAAKLIEQLGGEVVKIVFLMELAGLEGRKKLEKYDVASVIRYEGK